MKQNYYTIKRVSKTFSSSSTLKTKTFTDHMWSKKRTVLAMLITSGKPGEMWRYESMNIQTPLGLMTLNLPITYSPGDKRQKNHRIVQTVIQFIYNFY